MVDHTNTPGGTTDEGGGAGAGRGGETIATYSLSRVGMVLWYLGGRRHSPSFSADARYINGSLP